MKIEQIEFTDFEVNHILNILTDSLDLIELSSGADSLVAKIVSKARSEVQAVGEMARRRINGHKHNNPGIPFESETHQSSDEKPETSVLSSDE